MCNRKTRRLLKSNSNVGHYSNKNSPQKLTQKLHITIIGHLTYWINMVKNLHYYWLGVVGSFQISGKVSVDSIWGAQGRKIRCVSHKLRARLHLSLHLLSFRILGWPLSLSITRKNKIGPCHIRVFFKFLPRIQAAYSI